MGKISRMLTGQKAVIKGVELKGEAFKAAWDEEDKALLDALKRRKLKYLAKIWTEGEGCEKVKEFVEKDRKNPFFKFLTDENYDQMKRDSRTMPINEFVGKYA